MSLARHGRWLRVETKSASGHLGQRVINLDEVSTFYRGPQGLAVFRMADGDWWETTEDFETVCLRIMVEETESARREPTPPWTRDQIAMFPELAS